MMGALFSKCVCVYMHACIMFVCMKPCLLYSSSINSSSSNTSDALVGLAGTPGLRVYGPLCRWREESRFRGVEAGVRCWSCSVKWFVVGGVYLPNAMSSRARRFRRWIPFALLSMFFLSNEINVSPHRTSAFISIVIFMKVGECREGRTQRAEIIV